MFKFSFLLLTALFITGCVSAHDVVNAPQAEEPRLAIKLATTDRLKELPAPSMPVSVAVYSFLDQTGQHKPNDRFSEYSRAVTQGGTSILINALRHAGDGNWFRVIEREGLRNILQERQIIRATREEYMGRDNAPALPPLLFAGMIIEGGITSYDSNVVTGGVGARYFGIGGSTEYRQDNVTVTMRAVNVQTGEVVLSTDASKTVFSSAIQANVFRFLSFDKLLEADAGITNNEPVHFAVRQTIESALYAMIMEGAHRNIWQFADTAKQQKLVNEYLALKRQQAGGGSGFISETNNNTDPQQNAAAVHNQNTNAARPQSTAPIAPVTATENNNIATTNTPTAPRFADNAASNQTAPQAAKPVQPDTPITTPATEVATPTAPTPTVAVAPIAAPTPKAKKPAKNSEVSAPPATQHPSVTLAKGSPLQPRISLSPW